MIKKFSGAVAAATLGLTLLAGGVAHAAQVDPRPVRGTDACTDLVNGQSNVLTAATNVRLATDALNAALRATPVVDTTVAQRRQELADAQAVLRRTVANVTESLCKDGPATPAPTTTTTAPTVVVPAPTTVVERPTTIVRDRAPVMIRPERTVEVTTVVPTRDDNSVATVSGGQVSVVPEGSASTGQA